MERFSDAHGKAGPLTCTDPGAGIAVLFSRGVYCLYLCLTEPLQCCMCAEVEVLQALQHAWLKGGAEDRSTGQALSLKVVQRIQVGQPLCEQGTVLPARRWHKQWQGIAVEGAKTAVSPARQIIMNARRSVRMCSKAGDDASPTYNNYS